MYLVVPKPTLTVTVKLLGPGGMDNTGTILKHADLSAPAGRGRSIHRCGKR